MRQFVRISAWAAAVAVGMLAGLSAGARPAQGPDAAPKTVRVEVLDASGKPARGAEVALVTLRFGRFDGWREAPDGKAELAIPSDQNRFGLEESAQEEIAARAPGHAPATVKWNPESGSSATVRLKRGKRVNLEIKTADGRPLPEGVLPVVFAPKTRMQVLRPLVSAFGTTSGPLFHYYRVEQRAPGRFSVMVSPEDGPLTVYVDCPGLLRGFVSEAFEPKAWDKPLIVQLPAAGTVVATFEPKPAIRTDLTTFIVSLRGKDPMPAFYDLAAVVSGAGQPRRAVFPDLAPGQYDILAETGTGWVKRAWAGPETVAVQGGSSATVALKQRPALPALRVTDAATTGRPVRASAFVIRKQRDLFLLTGTGWVPVGPDGRIRFDMNQFAPRDPCEDASPWEYPVLVKAPGFAPKTLTLRTSTVATTEVIVPLERGNPIEIVLEPPEGMSIPEDLIPAVWFPPFGPILGLIPYTTSLQEVWAQSPVLDTERIAPGRYRVRITTGTEQLVVGVHHSRFLRGFVSDVFSLQDLSGSPLVLRLPKPGGLEVTADVREYLKTPGPKPDSIELTMMPAEAGDRMPINALGWQRRLGLQDGIASYQAADLAPGRYEVFITAAFDAGDDQRKTLSGNSELKVESGTTATATIALSDTTSRRGPRQFALPEVRVLSATGKPVTNARVFARRVGDEMNVTRGEAAGDGRYQCKPLVAWSMTTGEPLTSATAELLVTAPGHTATTMTLEVPTRQNLITVRLKKGREVELRLNPAEGTSIPETLEPIICDETMLGAAWIGLSPDSADKGFSLASVTRTGTGRYTFQVAKETSGLYVLIHEPGFLRGFQAGPFGADQVAKGRIEVDLPKPVTLTARFRPAKPDTPATYTACWAAIDRLVMLPGERFMYMKIAQTEAAGTTLEAQFSDLAPLDLRGRYSVEAGTGRLSERFGPPGQSYSDRAEADFQDGTSATVEILYEPFDRDMLKGPYTAVVTVLGRDDKPLDGKPFRVTYYDRKFGPHTVAQGTIPSSGVVELRGLAGGVDKPTSLSEFRGKFPPTYTFTIGDEDIGSIQFVKFDRQSGLVLPAHTDQVAEFTFRMPPVVGDMAPDIELTEVFGDGTLRLSDLRGQVVFLDFWATWCGPCQDPMKALNELAAKHKDDWAGKVALIGASIDDNKATVQKHVKKKGWESVRQMWCAVPDGSGGWEAPQVRTYGVRGVPTALLIDQQGRIVWRGHPAGFNKEGEITRLLQSK
ncbi:MAG: TlpA family protein disulfide reductase [Candidatus Sumerlaeaceae bacterium]|nr:TlpA family protein disulfide reductase [Candidatus Sumerlaeaceae bacterium]